MPSVPSDTTKKAPIGAICAPPTSTANNVVNDNVRQPRQPTSLQGLLRFAMEATKSEDAPSESQLLPMDDEKKRFLESALKSMTINVVEVLQEQIKKLVKVDTVKEGDDVTEYLEAIETILEYVDNIDVANDFHKIGGFMVLKPCLQCQDVAVRAGGCALIAELCQNNPYCQNVIIENDFIPMLLHILDTDNNDQVGVKCLYALSAIVRENSEGFAHLITYGGFNILLKTLQKDDDRFRIKTAFLLNSLCGSQPDVKSRLIYLEIVPILITLLSQERKPSSEYILSLLLSLVENSTTALNDCKNPQYNLKELLQNYITKIENKEDCKEEDEYCKRLLHLIFM